MSKFKSASTVVVFLAALFIGAIAAPTAGAYPGDYGCSSNEVGFYSDVSCRDQFGRRTTRDRASRVGNCRDLALGVRERVWPRTCSTTLQSDRASGASRWRKPGRRYRSQ